jgi:Flp pilus assembly pilin Flp
MEKIKDMFLRLFVKVKDQKGEVSVEWALVAVVMAGVILVAFMPGVSEALTQAIDAIKAKLTQAAG